MEFAGRQKSPGGEAQSNLTTPGGRGEGGPAWTWVWLEQLWQDLRYALRMLRRSPGFTAAAVLSLALGIGANTAIFSAIDGLLLKTLPVKEPGRLVFMVESDVVQGSSNYLLNYPLFEKLRDLDQVFEDVSVVSLNDRSNISVDGPGGGLDAGQARVALVSGNYFSMMGINAAAGRTFTPDDDRVPGGHPVAVISYGYWERKFGLAPDAVGRTLSLNSTTYDIIGVAPRDFSGDWVGRPADLWIPAMMQAQVMLEMPNLLKAGNGWVRIIARLKPGVSMQQAQAVAAAVYQQYRRDRVGPNLTPEQLQQIERDRLELRSGANGYSPQRDSFAQPLAILMIVAGVVLLIACANVANLLLSRSSVRQREMAVRLAIGAGRGRIVRQLLTESLLLAVLGGALGLLCSVWLTSTLATMVGTGPTQMDSRAPSPWVSLDLHIDATMLAFTAGLCLLTGIIFGMAPAFRGSKASLSSTLMDRGADAGGSMKRFGLGKLLVVAQVALSLVLLIGAGLFVRTLQNLKQQGMGVDRDHLLLVWTSPGQTGRQGPALAALWHSTLERISALPGVVSASAANHGLLEGNDNGGSSEMMTVEGQEHKPGLQLTRIGIAPGYFQTAGIQMLQGHDVTERDTETTPKVAIINETMARFFFDDQNPIGKHFGPGGPNEMIEIIGVVSDTKHGTPRDKRGFWYVPYQQPPSLMRTMCIEVRTANDPLSLAGRVRQELLDLDPKLPVLKIDTIEDQFNDVLAQERLVATLSSFFSALAVLLACIGLYGVMSYATARRTNEIGIRMALGATPARVLAMVLKESLWLMLAGLAIGLPAAVAVTRLISARLFGIGAADPLTMAGATLLIVAVAVVAAFLPARKASKVDPMRALKYE
jgi:macrolide transport system ATP-binding/permease protein